MKNKVKLYLKYIIIIGIFSRFLFMTFFSNLENDNYWEYGHIAKNIIEGKNYSYFYEKNGKIEYEFDQNSNPFPSAYMPPGYVITLVPLMIIENTILRNYCIFSFQILLSSLIIFILFKLTKTLYNDKVALIASLIYAIIPEFLYSSVTYGTTIFYHLGIILFFLLILSNYTELKKSLLIGILSSTIIYFRPEFLLFILCYSVVLIYIKKFKSCVIFLIIIFILVFPWVLRNYLVFNEFPVFSTNTGQNFYRGHNDYRPGIWSDEKLAMNLDTIKPSKNYEIIRNKLFINNAVKSIQSNPAKEIKNDFEKIIHLWLFDYYDKRITNMMYLIPWILILGFGIYGYFKTPKNLIFIIYTLFFIYHTLLAILFFAIPRYQTNMKIAIIPFTAYGVFLIIKQFKNQSD